MLPVLRIDTCIFFITSHVSMDVTVSQTPTNNQLATTHSSGFIFNVYYIICKSIYMYMTNWQCGHICLFNWLSLHNLTSEMLKSLCVFSNLIFWFKSVLFVIKQRIYIYFSYYAQLYTVCVLPFCLWLGLTQWYKINKVNAWI